MLRWLARCRRGCVRIENDWQARHSYTDSQPHVPLLHELLPALQALGKRSGRPGHDVRVRSRPGHRHRYERLRGRGLGRVRRVRHGRRGLVRHAARERAAHVLPELRDRRTRRRIPVVVRNRQKGSCSAPSHTQSRLRATTVEISSTYRDICISCSRASWRAQQPRRRWSTWQQRKSRQARFRAGTCRLAMIWSSAGSPRSKATRDQKLVALRSSTRSRRFTATKAATSSLPRRCGSSSRRLSTR